MSAITATNPFLFELRAALSSGVAPASAVIAAYQRHPQAMTGLSVAVGSLQLGASLEQAAADAREVELATLLRALSVAERAGSGALVGLDQVESALRERRDSERRVQVRSAQARGSVRVLTVAPMVVVGGFLALQPEALGFYRLGIGRISVTVTIALVLTARAWARRIVAAVPQAALRTDPLGAPLGSGAAETAELLAVAMSAGLAPLASIALVGRVGPPAARVILQTVDRRVGAGATLEDAFADTPLTALGAAMGAAMRWGSPVEPALRSYAAALRLDQRAALEQAAERAELQLVFPTTLLTLPAFLVAVVPPLLWTGFRP